MDSLSQTLFLTGVAFLLMGHELDAVHQKEWRFFFGHSSLSQKNASRLFNLLHIPLFVWILWNLNDPQFQLGFDLFLLIHAGLHWFLRNYPAVDFNNWFSRFWIFGGAGFGAAHIWLLLIK